MQEALEGAPAAAPEVAASDAQERRTVSTHVLVPEEQAQKLRELSRRTRIAQSDYLREAVDDLLQKYGRKPEEPR